MQNDAAATPPVLTLLPKMDLATIAEVGIAFYATAADSRLTPTDRELYATLATLPETPPAAELAATLRRCPRTIWYSLRRLADYGYLEPKGQAGYRNRVRQWETHIKEVLHALGSQARALKKQAAAAAAPAKPRSVQYGNAPATESQKNLIHAMLHEIMNSSRWTFSALKERAAEICDLDAGPATAAVADQLIQYLKQLKGELRRRAARLPADPNAALEWNPHGNPSRQYYQGVGRRR